MFRLPVGHIDPAGYYRLPNDVPPELASVHYKLLHGNSHLETLDADIAKWLDSSHERCGYELLTERDDDTGEWIVRFRFGGIPPRWSLAIGDIVQNLRNSLDNLVFGIGQSCAPRPLTEKEAEQFAFPIYGTKALPSDRAKHLMRHVPQTIQDFIKSIQPHVHGSDYHTAVLWIVHRLANIDKHRGIHLAAASSRAIRFLDPPKDMTGFRGWSRFTGGKGAAPLEQNEIIAKVPIVRN